jgi:hypothetical protein
MEGSHGRQAEKEKKPRLELRRGFFVFCRNGDSKPWKI